MLRAIKRIYAMKAVDSRIIERCMVRLFDLCMEQPHRKANHILFFSDVDPDVNPVGSAFIWVRGSVFRIRI